MIWFFAGAALAIVQMFIRYPDTLQLPHWIQGMLVTIVLGAAIYGTILWAIATYVF